jgi:hypothetical protein
MVKTNSIDFYLLLVSNLSFTKKTQNDFRSNRQKLLSLQTDSKDNEKNCLWNCLFTAVYERIKKLEREGIIDKYVVLNKAKVEKFVVFLS